MSRWLLARTSLSLSLCAVGCGGKSTPAIGNHGHDADGMLPWEARLTVGARFELWQEFDTEEALPSPLVVTVSKVESVDGARIYHLDWSDDPNGPDRVVVRDGVVTIGEATPEQMKEPFRPSDGAMICYGQDFSNPDGCDDVCDADLCLDAEHGVLTVSGLYAPGYIQFAQR